ncbi:MAG: neuraminidase-like domain-containing protein, partial [Actinomycetes bacterium]
DLDAANAALHELLAARAGTGWPVLSRQLHDELNLSLRDALVPGVLAQLGLDTSRDLFDRFLIDVDMGSRGMTSRVREAIAAVQLYLHRFLLGLEDGGTTAAEAHAFREKIKSWWIWMRSYRVWEANRKVFLYPENYLRPELRQDKTPAFDTLESDLLQGEITASAVEKAYKRYLDEYTEVSRLTIAGGYVYTKDQDPAGPRRLVLFGRTKTDPRRYYYRRAEFGSRDKLAALWEPWLPVELQIDADLVHPVHAFGRVFVFWAVPEAVGDDDPTSAVVTVRAAGDEQHVSAQAKRERVKIYYSFENLTKEWVPAQTLGTGVRENGTISSLILLVRPRMKDDRMSIMVSCSYTVAGVGVDDRRAAVLFDLNPELYADDVLDLTSTVDPAAAALALATDRESAVSASATIDRVARIFVDPVDPADV